jgi:hypothetical protein
MSAQKHTWKRDMFRRLLLLMHAKKCYAVLRNPGFIEVLANISAFGNKTVQPAEAWVKDSLTAEGQLASVIRHCFAKFEVPEFMEYVFAEGNKVHMLWYIQLGRGDSVQQLSAFPAAFTKAMAHEFRNTPKQFTVLQAIRRAQALGYSANAKVAEAVAWSSAIEDISNAGFRVAVLRFIAKANEGIAFDKLQQVIEYLVVMHRENAAYSFKGRTLTSVARQAAAYHAELAKRLAAENYDDWEPCGIANFEVTEESAVYKIVQLTNSEALYEEGHEMSHCVAEYADECAAGSTAIFSLRKFIKEGDGYTILATLEVQLPAFDIVQAKASYNDDISAEANRVTQLWAGKEKLGMVYDFYDYENRPVVPVAVAPAPAAGIPVRPAHNIPVQQHVYQPMRAANFQMHRQEPAGYTNDGMSGADILKIVLLILKVLWLLSKIR